MPGSRSSTQADDIDGGSQAGNSELDDKDELPVPGEDPLLKIEVIKFQTSI